MNFLEGKLSLLWSKLQEKHFKSNKKTARCKGQRWTADLIERLCVSRSLFGKFALKRSIRLLMKRNV